ncbi:small multi-drug export protein [Candidatus Margulisiibacteriota bacterium]
MYNNSEKKSSSKWRNVFSTIEGKILLASVALVVLYCAGLFLTYVFSPRLFQFLIGMTAVHIIFGRAAAMSFGYTVGMGHFLVVFINMLIETILVLFFYPLFVFSWQRLLVFSPLKRFMSRLTRAAERHRDKINKFGLIGLFIFVWFPFWMTGPLIGAIIGYLLGFRWWINLAAVFIATYIATIIWAMLLGELYEFVANLSPYAPMVLLVIVLFIVVYLQFLMVNRRRTKK